MTIDHSLSVVHISYLYIYIYNGTYIAGKLAVPQK